MLQRRFAWALRSQQVHSDFKITSNIYSHSIGSTLIHLDTEDNHKTFAVLFRTTPGNDTGVAHCLEHIALCGSVRYPVRDPFMKMLSRSLNSYMNAWTGSDFTMYPFSTKNEKDFSNLLSVYLDASFFPLLKHEDFLQEAWRLDWENSKLCYKGVVFNEMKGYASDPCDVLASRLSKDLMPGTTYEFNSGGDPQSIPKLTYEDLQKFHSDFYHPSNATFLAYGKLDIKSLQQEISEKVLNKLKPNPVNTQVPLARTVSKPGLTVVKVPADPVQTDPERPCKYVVSYLCDPIDADPFTTFVLSVLSSALLESQDSPMYRALLESRLGSKYLSGTGYNFSTKQGSFTIGLNGISQDKVEIIEKTIRDTLETVVSNGFKDDLIQSALHQIEVRNKEVRENFGLSLIANMIPFVLHGNDPLIPLYINSYVKKLRQMLAQDKPVFQDLIKKFLLNNDHHVRILAVPDNDYIEALNKAEQRELETIQNRLDSEGREKIKKDAEVLAEAQNQEENPDLLPTLVVGDIEKKGNYVVFDTTELVNGVKVHYIIQPTNGISYIRAKIDVKDLPSDLRAFFPLYSRLLNSLGTSNNPHNSFDTLKDLYTISGVSSAILSASSPTSLSEHSELFVMRVACLDRNLGKAFELFEELLTSVRFDEFDHIQNLIKRSVKSRTDNLLDSGTSYGSGIASGYLNVAASKYESLKTLNHDYELLDRLDESSNEIKSRLEQIHSFLMNRQSLEFLVHTSEDSNQPVISGLVNRLVSSISARFPSFNSPRTALVGGQFEPKHLNLFYTLPIQVNYVVQAFIASHYTSEDYAALKVLCEIMTMKSLLKEVREKGGAYGASASVDSLSGTLTLSSFRDPNNFGTFKAFEKAISAISKGKFSQRDIDEGKLGVFARVDKPVAVYNRGLHGFINSLTVEQMETTRSRLISVTKDEIVNVAKHYLTQDSCKVIFGPEGVKLEGSGWSVSPPIIKRK